MAKIDPHLIENFDDIPAAQAHDPGDGGHFTQADGLIGTVDTFRVMSEGSSTFGAAVTMHFGGCLLEIQDIFSDITPALQ
jgi:hypothetical protein